MVPVPESFREVQFMRRWWFVLLALLPAALVWWGAIQQLWFGTPWGNNPASDELMVFLLLIFGIAFPVFLLNIRMTTTVSDRISIRFSPFMLRPRTISPREIVLHQALQYRPIADYGGWGIKGFASDRVYNVYGDRGVKVTLENGNKVMIGSQRAEELNMAIGSLVRRQNIVK